MSKQFEQAYKDRTYENAGVPELVALVDPRFRRVLDVGCGTGANMRMLAAKGHQVTGLTLSVAEALHVKAHGYDCVACDLNDGSLPFEDEAFDALVLSHVLEHMPWPETVLSACLRVVRRGGGVYVALPNALKCSQRCQFLLGRFRYTDIGPLDRTHLRFFDFQTARSLIEATGLRVKEHFGVGNFPVGPLRSLISVRITSGLDRFASRHWPGMFAFHIVLAAVHERSHTIQGRSWEQGHYPPDLTTSLNQ